MPDSSAIIDSAELWVDGELLDIVHVKLQAGASITCGRIWADLPVLLQAFTSDSVFLTLSHGRQLSITVTTWPLGSAAFSVKAPAF